jgi:hypothetical protein
MKMKSERKRVNRGDSMWAIATVKVFKKIREEIIKRRISINKTITKIRR